MWKMTDDVKVGLHQGSAPSPLLFIIIMDVLAEKARTKPPWAMIFEDDLVLVREKVGSRGRTGKMEFRYRERGV